MLLGRLGLVGWSRWPREALALAGSLTSSAETSAHTYTLNRLTQHNTTHTQRLAQMANENATLTKAATTKNHAPNYNINQVVVVIAESFFFLYFYALIYPLLLQGGKAYVLGFAKPSFAILICSSKVDTI